MSSIVRVFRVFRRSWATGVTLLPKSVIRHRVKMLLLDSTNVDGLGFNSCTGSKGPQGMVTTLSKAFAQNGCSQE
jgi:hypothetical protein